ncbi:MAG: hypothetical protein ABIK62_02695, partial [candidate division WOR-3 bacterium]
APGVTSVVIWEMNELVTRWFIRTLSTPNARKVARLTTAGTEAGVNWRVTYQVMTWVKMDLPENGECPSFAPCARVRAQRRSPS